MLTREEILAKDDGSAEIVDVPEWGGQVKVRGMTGEERDRWETSLADSRGKVHLHKQRNIRAQIVAVCCCDESGNSLFQQSDVETLGRKSAAALDRVYAVAARLSGITKEDEEALAKNSESAPSG